MLVIEASGEAAIGISADGLPAMESVVPCPWGSPEQIEQAVKEATESIHIGGYFITGSKLIRNQAFDKRGEKTTTQISFRACKNEKEAEYVLSKVKTIIEAKMGLTEADEWVIAGHEGLYSP